MSYLVILDPGRPNLAGHIEVDRADPDQFAASGTGRYLQLDQCPDLAGNVFSNGVHMRFRSRVYRLGLSGFGAALTQAAPRPLRVSLYCAESRGDWHSFEPVDGMREA